MKVSINSKFVEGPYGGGMQFARFLHGYLEARGLRVVNNLKDGDIDIILHVNPFPKFGPSAYSYKDAYKYKCSHPQTVIIERVNECDERKGTDYMNKLLADAANKSDFVVFIASWLRPLLLKAGLPKSKPYRVILNGADKNIFNTENKVFWNGEGKLKIVTHHWSDNYNKGHDAYSKLDELLGGKLSEKFEFTYIGRLPEGLEYRNTRILEPHAGKELADELKRHHIYITASKNEPAGMHHIEGALCGLPLLYINSGALPEYCEGYGLEFNSDNLEEKLLEMMGNYGEYSKKIISYPNTAERMAHEYLKLFEELCADRGKPARKPKNFRKYISKFIKYPLMATYVLLRLLVRGRPTGEIRLNLAGVLPMPGQIVHGGKVKLLALREKFGDTWKRFNVAYFVSSGLPRSPGVWLKLYKLFGVKVVWNQNGVAYPALYPQDVVDRINSLYKHINLCDLVVYQTEFCKRSADKFATKFEGPSTILINPVDTRHFSPKQELLPEKLLTIVMSGHHFESRERMGVSVEAVRMVRESGVDARLLVIGRTEDCPKEAWIEEAGPYLQSEAPEIYRRGHLLLHLKYLDPCPTIVLEALACGLPVVAQANGGLPEMVDDKSGILLSVPEDYENLHYPEASEVARAILKVRENLLTYSRAAREQALKFDKEVWLARHEEIFNNLLK